MSLRSNIAFFLLSLADDTLSKAQIGRSERLAQAPNASSAGWVVNMPAGPLHCMHLVVGLRNTIVGTYVTAGREKFS